MAHRQKSGRVCPPRNRAGGFVDPRIRSAVAKRATFEKALASKEAGANVGSGLALHSDTRIYDAASDVSVSSSTSGMA